MTLQLTGKVAFITGGANGIGLGIAQALARAGVAVGIGDIEESRLDAALASLSVYGVPAFGTVLDISSADSARAAAAWIDAKFGKLHFLINGAGVTLRQTPIVDVTHEQWEWMFGVNVFGTLNMVQACRPLMRHGEGGRVVTVSSLLALQDKPALRNAAYRVSKCALMGLVDVLDREFSLADDGIGVSVVCPAKVVTTLGDASRRRPAQYGGPFAHHSNAPTFPDPSDDLPEVLMPERVGDITVYGIEQELRFIFTHTGSRQWLETRVAEQLRGLDALDAFNAAHPTAGSP